MSLLALAAAAVLTLIDPTSDALGDGTLAPPTSPVYANSAIFDLHEVVLNVFPEEPGTTEASDGVAESSAVRAPEPTRATLAVTLGAVNPDPDSPGGFSGVVVDVYLDAAPGGSEATLAGPGMLLPSGGGWEYAVRLSPAGALGVEYLGAGGGAEPGSVTALEPGAPAAPEAAPERLASRPLQLSIDGNRLLVDLPWSLHEEAVVYAVTGVYDPFTSYGWRALSSSPSPWAFSGGEQLVPVIDVLAVDQETQVQALRTGVLPRPQRTASTGTVWLVLMGVGVALAVTGLVLRRRVAPAQRSGRPYGLPPEEPEEVEEVVESASATADTPAPEDAVESELDRPFGLPPLDDEDDATAGAVEQGVKEGVEHGVDEGDEDDVADDEVDAVRASANDDGAAPNLDAVDAGVDDAAPDHVQAAPEPGVEDVEGVREGEIEPANDHGVAEADYTEDSAEALEEEAAEPTQAETADPFSGFDVTDTEDEDEEDVDLTGFDRRKSP